MNFNWNDKIQKLSDDIDFVRNKEKRHKQSIIERDLPPEKKKPEKVVKFKLPTSSDAISHNSPLNADLPNE